MATLRSILAVGAGVVAAGVVIATTEGLAHGRLSGDGPFIGAIIGYGLGAAAGTAVAAIIVQARAARLVPVLLALLALINLLSFSHPWWFAPGAGAALLVGWYIGTLIAKTRLGGAVRDGS
jgi:hypothetical protein